MTTTEALAVASTTARSSSSSAARSVLRVLGSRILQLLIVVTLIVIGTSLMVRLVPGDPAVAILGLNATPQSLEALRAELGLDVPLHVQIVEQLAGYLRGDFGTSTATRQPVLGVILQALPITLSLVVGATIISLLLSMPLGLLPAFGAGQRSIRALRLSMVTLVAIPSFLVGLYLLLLFSIQLRIAPAGGWAPTFPDALRYAWLPSLALGIFLVPMLVRSVERSTTQLMGEEFVEAAMSRGFSRAKVVVRHVLPNVMLPVITLVGFSFTILIGGAVIVESVYGIPGLGTVITRAVSQRDYPVIVGTTVFTGVLAVTISLITDVLHAVADPRVRNR